MVRDHMMPMGVTFDGVRLLPALFPYLTLVLSIPHEEKLWLKAIGMCKFWSNSPIIDRK